MRIIDSRARMTEDKFIIKKKKNAAKISFNRSGLDLLILAEKGCKRRNGGERKVGRLKLMMKVTRMRS